ncbi:unnamed protein product [Microthlaspi erraticum]|uniref:Uncharacterized protein n=1 Tax=Microthlaspi erraticum TaxID=1685480 RepID=A0A6D2IRV6_9BRAS|nr:unnamed protein product [Microthlaspi erraticum]
MFSPLRTVVSSGLGRRSLEGQPMDGELELELPSNSLCSMRRLVLQNLMSIQPGSVDSPSVGLQLHKDRLELVKEGMNSLCALSPLIFLPILVREMMGLIPMSRSFTSPSLIVQCLPCKEGVGKCLVHISQDWAPDLSSLGP